MFYKSATMTKTADLRPYQGNAKKHSEKQIRNLQQSLKKYGFTQPIVIDRDNTVIIGHGRLEAAKRNGLTEVPCILRDDLTPEEIKQLRLIDNLLNESPWDIEILTAEISAVDFDGFDLEFEQQQQRNGSLLDYDGAAAVLENDLFDIPPASALPGYSGQWLTRKRAWIGLGVHSERGR